MAMTVLVVDDHPTFRRFVRRLLEESGFSVVGEAGDCKGALEAARALRPQAILLDVMLPDGSGLEIASTLSAGEPAAAVVLTSSRRASDFGAALEESSARGFLCKDELSGAAFAALVDPRDDRAACPARRGLDG